MDLTGARVCVHTTRYVGPGVVRSCNADDTVTVLIEETGTELCVSADSLTRLPVTVQPEDWIAERLLEAWDTFFRHMATHTAQRLLTYGQYGEPAVVEEIFRRYADAPEILFRELYQEPRR